MPLSEAFLDIETTGLSPVNDEITVTGIYRCRDGVNDCVQFVGRDNNAEDITAALAGTDVLYTYNGSRFDLPFIQARLGIDLTAAFSHRDLMYDCWSNRLRGGLKSVERQLGIKRELPDVNGLEAVRLWWRYVESFDLEALDTLLKYNREDVVNLKVLRDMLVH